MKKAVCLLSGGLDSATALFFAKKEGYDVIALTVNYGQKHKKELEFARVLSLKTKVKQHEVSVSFPWNGSSLLDSSVSIPKHRAISEIPNKIPSTYVPARNTVFLSLATSCAEAEGANAIFIGVNALDYSGYPDCRPEFINSFSETMRLGTKIGIEGSPIEIKTPLLKLTKKEIVLLASQLGVPFDLTWSCYQGGNSPCGECDSCLLRKLGFEEARINDPLENYVSTNVK